MSDFIKFRAEAVGATIMHASLAVQSIAKLLEEDQIRRESHDGSEFLTAPNLGGLLSGLKVLGTVLYEKGLEVEQLAEQDGA
ncbi:hypothetical protein [Pseudomonas sp. D(2018)]|uniref:hypothetical protein n=1 Tax=Pseudomonas sp. D(2018) TaxID=2502238 RepID=UPI0010F77849|nr:hypothetical protein [Pseudomonas sp. D(2018)]